LKPILDTFSIPYRNAPSYFSRFYTCFLVCILIIACAFFIYSGVNNHNLKQSFKAQLNRNAAKGFLISDIKSSMGYGGFIHHFKNYIIRSKKQDYQGALKNILEVKKKLNQYNFLDLSEEEKNALREIDLVTDQYQQNLALAKNYFLKHQASSITQLDNIVKVDDTPLIEAIWFLKKTVNQYREDIYLKEQQAMADFFNELSVLVMVVMYFLLVAGIIINHLLEFKTKQLNQEIIVNKKLLKELNLNATAFDANEAILITDVNKKIIKVNNAFSVITGYKEQEVIGKTPKLLQSGKHDKQFYTKLWQSIGSKGSWSGEIVDRKKSGEIFIAWTNISQILDENGNVEYYLSHFSDMTEYKKTQAAFIRRVKIEKVISEIAITVLESEFGEIDKAINNCLKLLGEELAVDRSYLFKISDDALTMSNSHEWCDDGVEPMIDSMQEIAIELYPWLMQQLFDNKVVQIEDINTMPAEARNEYLEMQRQSIQSILLVPISDKGKITGYFGFDRVKQKRDWRDEDIVLFKLIAKIFHLAQYRHEIEMENARNLEKAVQLLTENTKLLDKNRVLAVKTIHAQEQERHYLAHELHDELGQLVTAIRMDVNYLQSLISSQNNSSAIQMMDSIDGLSRKMISNLHSTIQRIRPETLDHLGLIPALDELVSDWMKHNRTVKVTTDFMIENKDLDENTTVTLYRAVQEALTNISKHAYARHVEISLNLNQSRRSLQLTIQDDGKGIDPDKIINDGVGLLAMEERVNALQGGFTITSGENESGTCINIQIPLMNSVDLDAVN